MKKIYAPIVSAKIRKLVGVRSLSLFISSWRGMKRGLVGMVYEDEIHELDDIVLK